MDSDVSPERKITYFASTHTRGKQTPFGIRAIDRMKHMYVIGKTGMGKSTLLENLAIQDIQNGEGLCFIDPHGSTAEKLLEFVPQDRIGDVLYLAPFDLEAPIGFNVMEDVGYDKRHLVASGLMSVFKRIWVDAWSARMEYILQNALLALLEYPDSTLLDVNRMLINKEFRKAVVNNISDPIVKAFWVEEFATYTDRYTQEATPAIQNKIGQFTSNPLIRNIVGQPRSSFDVRKMMDEKKIIIVNLSKGRIGETNTVLLGSLLTVKIYLGALSRADEAPGTINRLPPFYFYVDEFQSVANDSFANILSEARKYKLALTIANQYIEQMEENVRNAVFGNVGTMITFRVGPMDAEVMKVIFEPTFTAEDLVGLGVGAVYLTLMIDGVGSPPFSAQTLPPIEAPEPSFVQKVMEQSKARYGRIRSEVEKDISDKSEQFRPEAPSKEKKPGDFRDRPPRPGTPGGERSGGAGGGASSRPFSSGDRQHRSDRPPQRDRPTQGDRPPRFERPVSEERPPAERAAHADRPPVRVAPQSMKSPADILREKMQRKMGAGEAPIPVERERPLPPPPKEHEKPSPLRDALKAALKDAPVKQPIDNKTEKQETKEAHQESKPASVHHPHPAAHAHAPEHAPRPHTPHHAHGDEHTKTPAPERAHEDAQPTPRGKTHEQISEEIIRKILYGTDERT